MAQPPLTHDTPATDALRGLDRRRFLAAAGLASAGTLGAGALLSFPGRASGTTAPTPSRTPLTSIGLYSYGWDYLANRDGIRELGLTSLRTSDSGMYDDAWRAMSADGLDVHVTITGADRSEFSDDAAWIADYLGRIDRFLGRWPARWVEIWNEPNFGLWSGATAVQKQAAYGTLLVAASAHIRSRWPGVGVIGFGAGGASAAAPGFIRGVLQAVPAAASSFDVCSLHPYVGDTAPDRTRQEAWGSWSIAGQVTSLRAMGITTPLWFTECGWQIGSVSGGKYAKPAASVVTPDLQAAYRVRLAVLAMSLGVERVNHMYVVDTNSYNGGFFVDGHSRPQAAAISVQQALISQATAIRTQVQSDTMASYVLDTPSAQITVAWSDRGGFYPARVPVGSRIFNIYGQARGSITRANQFVQLRSLPLYLIHPRRTQQ